MIKRINWKSLVGVGAALVGVSYLLSSSLSTSSSSVEKSAGEAQASGPHGSEREPASASGNSGLMSATQKAAGVDSALSPDLQGLASYAHLHQKVFLSDEDKTHKRELLADDHLLAAAATRLLKPALDFDSRAEQNAAIDLLIEAVQRGNKDAAAKALNVVVSDPQIESTRLPIDERKNLAGIKADVLFQWSSVDPARSVDLQSRLPGAVSRKIWENVVDVQDRNLKESALVGAADVSGSTASRESTAE